LERTILHQTRVVEEKRVDRGKGGETIERTTKRKQRIKYNIDKRTRSVLLENDRS